MRIGRMALVGLSVGGFLIPGSSWAASNWNVRPSVSHLFGETTYRLSALTEGDDSSETLTQIRSRLDFPLHAVLVGVAVGWEPHAERAGRWSFEAGFSASVSDPTERMTDKDWIGSTQIACTESDADLDLKLLTAEARLRLLDRGRGNLSLLARFEYERISQSIVGFEGWAVDLDSGVAHGISGTEPSIDYEVTYMFPQLGVSSMIELTGSRSVTFTCSAGVVLASDRDDHLLRGRLAEADAVGFGLSSSAEWVVLAGSALGHRVSVDLVGRFHYFEAQGDQKQRWYEDDGEIGAGTEVTGIPHEFRSYQFSIGLNVGFGI